MKSIAMIDTLLDHAGKQVSDEVTEVLEKDADSLSEEERKLLDGMNDTLMRGFCEAATDGYEFVPRQRVVERFGSTLAGNYPEAGPSFLRMANTYWTFKLALSDASEGESTAAHVLLTNLERTVGALFFPTPGPMQIDPDRREADQRAILQEMAPRMDVEEFVAHNPILHRDRISQKSTSGCLVAPVMAGRVLIDYLTGGGA